MYICGKNVAKEYLNGNEKIKKVFLNNNFNDTEIMNLLKTKKIKIDYVDKRVLDNKTMGNHQGIILEVDDFE